MEDRPRPAGPSRPTGPRRYPHQAAPPCRTEPAIRAKGQCFGVEFTVAAGCVVPPRAGVAALGEPAFLSEVPLTTAERRAVRGKERTQYQREEYPKRSISGRLSC